MPLCYNAIGKKSMRFIAHEQPSLADFNNLQYVHAAVFVFFTKLAFRHRGVIFTPSKIYFPRHESTRPTFIIFPYPWERYWILPVELEFH